MLIILSPHIDMPINSMHSPGTNIWQQFLLEMGLKFLIPNLETFKQRVWLHWRSERGSFLNRSQNKSKKVKKTVLKKNSILPKADQIANSSYVLFLAFIQHE